MIPNGNPCSSSVARTLSTRMPSAEARWRASSSSRDFPIPAGPSTTKVPLRAGSRRAGLLGRARPRGRRLRQRQWRKRRGADPEDRERAGRSRRRRDDPSGEDARRLERPHPLPLQEGPGHQEQLCRHMRGRLAAPVSKQPPDGRQRGKPGAGRDHPPLRRSAPGHLQRAPARATRATRSPAIPTARASRHSARRGTRSLRQATRSPPSHRIRAAPNSNDGGSGY